MFHFNKYLTFWLSFPDSALHNFGSSYPYWRTSCFFSPFVYFVIISSPFRCCQQKPTKKTSLLGCHLFFTPFPPAIHDYGSSSFLLIGVFADITLHSFPLISAPFQVFSSLRSTNIPDAIFSDCRICSSFFSSSIAILVYIHGSFSSSSSSISSSQPDCNLFLFLQHSTMLSTTFSFPPKFFLCLFFNTSPNFRSGLFKFYYFFEMVLSHFLSDLRVFAPFHNGAVIFNKSSVQFKTLFYRSGG